VPFAGKEEDEEEPLIEPAVGEEGQLELPQAEPEAG